MYFAITQTPNSILPNCRKFGDVWLSSMTADNMYGYKLGDHGGNFVEFADDNIKFSFHKDFKLYRNNEVLMTNLPIDGEEVSNDIIQFNINSQECHKKQFNYSEISYNDAVKSITDILLDNIKTCVNIADPKIVYTAGLDSSTVVYLAHYNQIDFCCLIHNKYKDRLPNPFTNVEYVEFQEYPKFNISVGPIENIKPGFYQAENNNLITGYYGDNALLHHRDLYYQSKHLCDINIELYDLTPPSDYKPFKDKTDIINSVMYINTQNYFRHWFEDFQILDPYRDPRLLEIVLSLPLKDLIEQMGSAKIQKDIIKSMNHSWLNNICDHKNDYTKF